MNKAVAVNQLMAKFMKDNWHRDPYKIGARVFREWYSKHPIDEPIPEEMLPIQEMYDTWDQELENYVIAGLRERFGYAELRGVGFCVKVMDNVVLTASSME